MTELWKMVSLLIFLLLFSSQEKMEQIEATNTCEALSRYFLGFCLFDHHCEMACKMESYTTGKCLGLKPRCICLKTCHQPSPPQTPLPPPTTPPAPPPKTPKPPHHPKTPCIPGQYPRYKDRPQPPNPPQYGSDPNNPYPPYKDPLQPPNPPQYTLDPNNPSKHLHHPNSLAKPSRILKSQHLSKSLSLRRSFDYSSKWCRKNK